MQLRRAAIGMPFGRPCCFDLVYDTARLAFPKQPAVSLDGIIDADEAQRIPHAGLRRRHHVHAEFPLQRLDGFDHRPMRRGEKDRVGQRVRANRRATRARPSPG